MASPKRWTRLRWPRPLPGAALALTAVLAAAGCAAAHASAAGAGSHASGGPPAITAAQARQVFNSYVATTAKADRTGDGKLALSVVTGVQQAAVATALKEASLAHRKPSLDPYRYRKPTFYLPQQGGYPHFFIATATRSHAADSHAADTPAPAAAAPAAAAGQSGGAGAAAIPAGGVTMPRDGTALLLFEQASATTPWQLDSVSVLPAGVTMPRLAAGQHGAIAQVPLPDASLLARPDIVGPLQAAVVDDGPASAAARAVAGGPLTTGVYRAARGHAFGLRAPRGDVYQWELEGSNLAKFALRTADGGALVCYAMYLNVTVAVPGYINGANPIQPGPPIRYPRELDPWVSPTGPAPRVNVEEQQLLSFAAIDPPPGKAKIRVIAIGGTLNYATGS